jgi:hypothetical protein
VGWAGDVVDVGVFVASGSLGRGSVRNTVDVLSVCELPGDRHAVS